MKYWECPRCGSNNVKLRHSDLLEETFCECGKCSCRWIYDHRADAIVMDTEPFEQFCKLARELNTLELEVWQKELVASVCEILDSVDEDYREQEKREKAAAEESKKYKPVPSDIDYCEKAKKELEDLGVEVYFGSAGFQRYNTRANAVEVIFEGCGVRLNLANKAHRNLRELPFEFVLYKHSIRDSEGNCYTACCITKIYDCSV